MGKPKTIKEAINKHYLVKAKSNGKSDEYTSGYLVLPKCMVGKRIVISEV